MLISLNLGKALGSLCKMHQYAFIFVLLKCLDVGFNRTHQVFSIRLSRTTHLWPHWTVVFQSWKHQCCGDDMAASPEHSERWEVWSQEDERVCLFCCATAGVLPFVEVAAILYGKKSSIFHSGKISEASPSLKEGKGAHSSQVDCVQPALMLVTAFPCRGGTWKFPQAFIAFPVWKVLEQTRTRSPFV